MSKQELNGLDDFERFVRSTITPWSREQRIALAASMAERWLPVCDAFSAENEWGDPSTFQRAVDAVWNSVLGHTLTNKAIFERYRQEAEVFLTDKKVWEDLAQTLENTGGDAMPYFRAWAFRYSRRKQAIETTSCTP